MSATKNEENSKLPFYNTYLAGNHNDSIPSEVFVCVLLTGVIDQSKGWVDGAANHSDGKGFCHSRMFLPTNILTDFYLMELSNSLRTD